MTLPPFHLAFPVDDLAAARRFYGELLGCPEGRSTDRWIDFDLYGHQIVAHLVPAAAQASNAVDGDDVPVPHFEIVLPMAQWEALAARLERCRGRFRDSADDPLRRAGWRAGDDVLLDTAGNALEFKAMADPAKLFAKA